MPRSLTHGYDSQPHCPVLHTRSATEDLTRQHGTALAATGLL
ncbi:hypothetical protein [Verrucosispora sp. WMMD1129]|nr:hypothetical protein [Verrucosispora sp. WMMD1129]WFE47804.1 hypothetical protein O7624_27445 [Verrucosispora sp. WMMD1129]